MNLRNLFLAAGITVVTVPASAQKVPEPYGLTPSTRQVEWCNHEVIAFSHFGINTFEGCVNEGDRRTPAAIFNPTTLDCGQQVRTPRLAGTPSAIIAAKHTDGLCLRSSKYTDYSVKSSAWRSGKEGAIHELVDACEEYGIKIGIYLGSYDRHEHLPPLYTTEEYKQYYGHQLEELMGGYGKVWETWWDGAGADELITPIYTHWYKIVREKRPDCVIFGIENSYPLADVRWMGNEPGKTDDPCRPTTDSIYVKDGRKDYEGLNEEVKGGDTYIPTETDVSIRPSWFHHAGEDNRVKNVKEFWDTYCISAGHNSVLLLNFPPDHRGLIRLTGSLHAALLKQGLDETFGGNLLAKAEVRTTDGRGGKSRPEFLTDNNKEAYSAGRDGAKTSDIVFTLSRQTEFDCLMIREVIELGYRTTKQSVEYSNDGRNWTPTPEAADKQMVGYKWIVRFEPVKAKQVCFHILNGFACPAIHTFGVYKQSALFQ